MKTKNAYQPWKQEDYDILEFLFCEGKKIEELSAILGRNNGAIKLRIDKWEVPKKYRN